MKINLRNYKFYAILLLITVFILIVVVIKISYISQLFKTERKCKNCNIILITLDVLGSNHLPCYGYSRNTAPNLCVFANDNIYFTKSFSNSALTLPSAFSLLTSLYPHMHGMNILIENTELDRRYKTLTELLKSFGYKTFFYGPFDNPHLPLTRGLERGFDEFNDTISTEQYANDGVWTKNIEGFLENLQKNKPAFLFLYLSYVGHPYLLGHKNKFLFTNDYFSEIPLTQEELYSFSPELVDYVLDSLSERVRESQTAESKKINLERLNKLKSATNIEEAEQIFKEFPRDEVLSYFHEYNFKSKVDVQNQRQIEYLKALYDETITGLDHKLGILFNLLKENKFTDNTIVVITSQHGEEFVEHGLYGHGDSLYNPAISVPLIFSIPKLQKKKLTELSQNIDVYPTILGLLGLQSKSLLEGKDLSDLIYQKRDAGRNKYILSEAIPLNLFAIQDKQWKLLIKDFSSLELFNLNYDVQEQDNIAASNPEIVGNILKNLDKIIQKRNRDTFYNFPVWLDDVKKRKIIKEGYF